MKIADVSKLRGVEAGMVARFGGSGGGDPLYCIARGSRYGRQSKY